jgi:hypothetical protein
LAEAAPRGIPCEYQRGSTWSRGSVDMGPLAGVIRSSSKVDLSSLVEPVKAKGEAKLRPTEDSGFSYFDMAGLYNRPHGSLGIGGGDNASFKTWFSEDRVSADGVPFLVQRDGKDVLVSENNTENVYEIKGVQTSAAAVHFLVWGYNFPSEPARLCITFTDGSKQECEIPLSEWTDPNVPMAFDFTNTIQHFQHAAIAHGVVRIKHPDRKIASIISSSGVYGLVAITLEENRAESRPRQL